ncbi:MAG TPA: glycoside hydrolase family 16 protein [Chloroflexia bacterium]|nr:glycoside hydrolase family 16 protein [Chloroflexia bacterium]
MQKKRFYSLGLLAGTIVLVLGAVSIVTAVALQYLPARTTTATSAQATILTPAVTPQPTAAPFSNVTPTPVPIPTSTPTPTPSPTPTPTPTPVPQPSNLVGKWNLVFSDEFNDTELNAKKWTTCYWWASNGGCTIDSNNELEWYQPENVLIKNGILSLQARVHTIKVSDGSTFKYTSGMISSGRNTKKLTTQPRFAFKYGYAEIKAKIPKGKGLWPAFWLLPTSQDSLPEIDIMEILGHDTSTVRMHYHYRSSEGDEVDTGENWSGPDFSAGWHTYAVDWEPGAIVWYVDGVERRRYTDQAHIPAEPMYLLADLAVGGDWPGSPDAHTPFPSTFDIDYMRVWTGPQK